MTVTKPNSNLYATFIFVLVAIFLVGYFWSDNSNANDVENDTSTPYSREGNDDKHSKDHVTVNINNNVNCGSRCPASGCEQKCYSRFFEKNWVYYRKVSREPLSGCALVRSEVEKATPLTRKAVWVCYQHLTSDEVEKIREMQFDFLKLTMKKHPEHASMCEQSFKETSDWGPNGQKLKWNNKRCMELMRENLDALGMNYESFDYERNFKNTNSSFFHLGELKYMARILKYDMSYILDKYWYKEDEFNADVAAAKGQVKEGYPSGQHVLNLQNVLFEVGCNNFPGNVDGHFGPRTREALKCFQRKNGLEQTGMVDADTIVALNKVVKDLLKTC